MFEGSGWMPEKFYGTEEFFKGIAVQKEAYIFYEQLLEKANEDIKNYVMENITYNHGEKSYLVMLRILKCLPVCEFRSELKQRVWWVMHHEGANHVDKTLPQEFVQELKKLTDRYMARYDKFEEVENDLAKYVLQTLSNEKLEKNPEVYRKIIPLLPYGKLRLRMCARYFNLEEGTKMLDKSLKSTKRSETCR